MLRPELVCVCLQLEEDLRVLRHEIRQSGETGVQLPVNFRRLIWNAQKIFKCKPHRPGPSGTSIFPRSKPPGLLPGSPSKTQVPVSGHVMELAD